MPKKQYSVLLVEDDPDQIMIYKTQLEIDGYKFFNCKNYQDLKNILKNNKIDIILLDILLGDVSGKDILKKLNQEKIVKKIPVVVFSNLKGKGDAKLYQKLGAKDFWVKTEFVPKDVSRKIKSMIEG